VSDELFDIVFLGQAIEGFAQADVEKALSAKLKLPIEKTHLLFQGKPVTLKRGANKALTSGMYVQLRAIGADIRIRRYETPAAAPDSQTQHIQEPSLKPQTAETHSAQVATSSKAGLTYEPKPEHKPELKPELKPEPKPEPAVPTAALDSTPTSRVENAPNPYQLQKAKLQQQNEKAGLRALATGAALLSLLICITALGFSAFATHWPKPLPSFEVNGDARPNGTLLLTTPERAVIYDQAGLVKRDLSLAELDLTQIRGTPALLTDNTFALAGTRRFITEHHTEEKITGTFICTLEPTTCQFIESLKVFPPARDLFFEPASERLYINHGDYISAFNPATERARSTTLALQDETFALFDGLLYATAPDSPALRVYSVDDRTFMRQLDQLLFLNPNFAEPDQARLVTFAHTVEGWWLVMAYEDRRVIALFSDLGDFKSSTSIDEDVHQLIVWRNSLLAIPKGVGRFNKFSLVGAPEAEFNSAALLNSRSELESAHLRERSFIALSATILIGLLPLTLFGFLTQRWLERLEQADRNILIQGLLELPPTIQWHSTFWNWPRFAVLLVAGALISSLSSILLFQLANNPLSVAASIVPCAALCLVALYTLTRGNGHIGNEGETIVIVDAVGNWESARGSTLRHWGPYIATRHLVYYSGWHCSALRIDSTKQLRARALRDGLPLTLTGLIALLVRAKHPHAKALLGIILTLYSAGILVAAAYLAELIRWS